MDQIDRKLLNAIQSGFPLTEEPYKELGNDLEITETEVMERLGELKAQNVVRQISAIFDTRPVSYTHLTLPTTPYV